MSIRKTKSTLYDPTDPNSVSAGSFFVNPIISAKVFEEIQKVYVDVPNWPQKNGLIKVPAAWLIEKSGFSRGFISGKAGLSQKHALILINKDGAKAEEVLKFSEEIGKSVYNTFKVKLEREPVLVGTF